MTASSDAWLKSLPALNGGMRIDFRVGQDGAVPGPTVLRLTNLLLPNPTIPATADHSSVVADTDLGRRQT